MAPEEISQQFSSYKNLQPRECRVSFSLFLSLTTTPPNRPPQQGQRKRQQPKERTKPEPYRRNIERVCYAKQRCRTTFSAGRRKGHLVSDAVHKILFEPIVVCRFYCFSLEGGLLTELSINLVHHCPICKTPLSNKRNQLRCLGQHVEWCNKYHRQLFKIGEF